MTVRHCVFLSAIQEDPAREMPRGQPVQVILERMRGSIAGPSVTVATLVRAMDPAVQPVLLLLPALILVSPLSGLPGLSWLGGLTIAPVALKILLGRPAIWFPAFVLHRHLPADRLRQALERLDRPARFIDRKSLARAGWSFAFPGRPLALVTCAVCGLAMPFLELVPFSATTLAMVVTGWSLTSGELRAAHFLATHMMQAVAFAALLAAWALPDRAKRPLVLGGAVLCPFQDRTHGCAPMRTSAGCLSHDAGGDPAFRGRFLRHPFSPCQSKDRLHM